MTRTEAFAAIAEAANHTDEGGTIQGPDLVSIFPGQRLRHHTTTLRVVARWIEADSGVDADEMIESTW